MPVLRASLAIAVLTVVTLILLPVQWLAVRFEWGIRRTVPVLFHRIVCRLLGVRVIERGRMARERSLLLTSNHMSWLDIPVLGSRVPLSFVAKSEVATWPIFGIFARLQRSVFVDRQRRSATGRTMSEIARRMTDGDAMVLFAEGTSSDAATVLPFRTALIGAAQAALAGDGNSGATVWVQPLAIVYTRLQGLLLDQRTRPLIAWYGDMDLAPHLWRLLKKGAVDVEVIWGEPVAVAPGSDRKALARQLEEAVRTAVTDTLFGHRDRSAESSTAGENEDRG
ncbi:lysophospholipid acyltransferase family protein [Breoghania sp.]|uniref:lysophospholipid acyltransferase family protein n=1 Tax=Breoghania sp. TaxID=2065378 RepID=UPI002630DDDD|nr:lysophospholipid acyltransferase family protein [Breoghania sp.]MDJ0930885.1 lysophospholipid acyltransferase family protein [Breoghania sp.]